MTKINLFTERMADEAIESMVKVGSLPANRKLLGRPSLSMLWMLGGIKQGDCLEKNRSI